MPIYDRNNTKSVTVEANMNYGYNDIGRILSECVANDMILFNAVIRNDFKESAAIREGTMVDSELQSFREEAKKNAWTWLVDKLKKFWAKIKGVFKNAYDQIVVWMAKNAKVFVKGAKERLAKKKDLNSVKLPRCYTPNASYEKFIDGFKTIEAEVADEIKKDGEDNDSKDAIVNSMLRKALLGKDDVTIANALEVAKESFFEEHPEGTTYGQLGVTYDQMFDNISTSSKYLKVLRKANKAADNAIRGMVNDILGESKNEESAEGAKKPSKFRKASKNVSAAETAMTVLTRAAIKTVRFSIAQSRRILGVLAAAPVNVKESTIMALYEADDDIAEIDEITPDDVAEVKADLEAHKDEDEEKAAVIVNFEIEADDDCE